MTPLSTSATRLLSVLNIHQAFTPASALTDQVLAERAHLPARDLIDAAHELIEAGYLVLARCERPFGRYLLRPGDDLAAAYKYARTLRRRGVQILKRARSVRRCIERYESTPRRMEPAGQFPLFVGPVSRPVDPVGPVSRPVSAKTSEERR